MVESTRPKESSTKLPSSHHHRLPSLQEEEMSMRQYYLAYERRKEASSREALARNYLKASLDTLDSSLLPRKESH